MGFLYNSTQHYQYYTILPILHNITQYYQYYMMLQFQLARCRFLWPYMALILLWVCHPGPEAWDRSCSKRVHIFTGAVQYSLSKDKKFTILHNEELDSYLFTFGDAQKALTIFSLSKNARSVFSDVFPRNGAVSSKKVRAMLGFAEGKTILDRQYCAILCSIM